MPISTQCAVCGESFDQDTGWMTLCGQCEERVMPDAVREITGVAPELEGTGGNCAAWVARLESGAVLVITSDATEWLQFGQPVTVCLYATYDDWTGADPIRYAADDDVQSVDRIRELVRETLG